MHCVQEEGGGALPACLEIGVLGIKAAMTDVLETVSREVVESKSKN